MSKMTDKEIYCEKCFHKDVCEKRTCAECGGLCDECEIYHQYDGKPNILNCEDFADVDIINRQQAEIENARIGVKSYKSKYESAVETARELKLVIAEKQAEIERLGKAENFEHNVTKLFDKYKVHIKSEAIKECLGKIEQMDVSESDDYIMIKKYNFDNLVKEMVGEGK